MLAARVSAPPPGSRARSLHTEVLRTPKTEEKGNGDVDLSLVRGNGTVAPPNRGMVIPV